MALLVTREARAAVMKAARAAPHFMVEEVVEAGTAVQAALMRIFLYPPVVGDLGTLAAA